VAVRPGGRARAPLPAMLALAWQQGLPVEFSLPPQSTGLATEFGPYATVDGPEYTWSLKGLARYIRERRFVGPANDRAQELTGELVGEVDRMVQAGHLAPLVQLVSREGRWTLCWIDPSETLYYLSEILPVLPPDRQEKLRAYLRAERQAHPPEKVLFLKANEGARRDAMPREFVRAPLAGLAGYGDATIGANISFFQDKAPSLFRCYALERCSIALGEAPEAAAVAFSDRAIDDLLQAREWDTLGWFKGKYAVRRAWGHRRETVQYTVRCANRDLAGLIGYLRLHNLEGPPEVWGQFARLAALRFAAARYGRYQAAAGIVGLPDNPAAVKAFARWGDYSKPETYVFQLADLNQYGAVLSEGVIPQDTTMGVYQFPFMDMVPEVARMLRDWGLADVVRRYVGYWQMQQPELYAAFAQALRGEESRWAYASDSDQLFMASAWIAGTPPEQLQHWLDVPWAPLGDLYFMHKLAETLKAFRGVQWTAARQP
jgi:hypothetical protein